MKKIILAGSLIFLFFGIGCNSSTDPIDPEPQVQTGNNNEEIYIVDRTGRKWDITHAVNKYGFKPGRFQFGLGPFAIPPIEEPEFFVPGDPGYPREDETFLVIGTTIHNDSRAYPIFVLKSHEIVDEVFDSTYVAVAY